ncbi:MAG: hypothetical protein ABEJ79_04075 [Halolamina sp.]
MANRANPAFAAGSVGVALAATAYALTGAPLTHHTYIHVMAGVLWTGIDLFMGLVLGPVIGGLDEEQRADLFGRLTPKMGFLLPALATTTIATGIGLAQRVGWFVDAEPWLALFTLGNVVPILLLLGWQFDAWTDPRWAAPFAVGTAGSLAWAGLTVDSLGPVSPYVLVALGIVTVLSVQGFGVLLPGEVRIYRQVRSATPDTGVMATVGQRNATLAGVQGLFQLGIVAVMVGLRYGGL